VTVFLTVQQDVKESNKENNCVNL